MLFRGRIANAFAGVVAHSRQVQWVRNEDGTFKYTKAGANEYARACDLIDPRSKDKVRKLPKEGSFSARGASYALRFLRTFAGVLPRCMRV